MNPIQSLMTMAKSGDASMAIFITSGAILLDKGETIPALVCFFFALISAMFSLWCKSAYHLGESDKKTIEEFPSNPNETE